jgi:hypothetical protein
MNWFQQNRWLGTFLVVFGISVLIAGVLFFLAMGKWNSARSAFDTAAAERSRLERLDPFPNDANYRKMKLLLKNYSAALDKLKEELKTEVLPAPPLAPNEFQSRLLQTMLATTQKARANKVKFPAIFYLGFDPFITSLPNSNETARLLGQELSQIQMLINILLDARVDSVSSLQRMPLPEERGVPPAPSPVPTPGRKPAGAVVAGPKMVERNVVDLSFKASPAAARKVLNQIASSPSQFYIIRTLYVRNEKDKGPPRGKTAETNPPVNEPSAPSQPANTALNFIVGDEHIEISARVEMLKFTF